MINDRISQAILVSGESGELEMERLKALKSLMQYLSFVGGKAQAEGRSVQQQILEVCSFFLLSTATMATYEPGKMTVFLKNIYYRIIEQVIFLRLSSNIASVAYFLIRLLVSQSNPVPEAFVNAKTVRNNNSW